MRSTTDLHTLSCKPGDLLILVCISFIIFFLGLCLFQMYMYSFL